MPSRFPSLTIAAVLALSACAGVPDAPRAPGGESAADEAIVRQAIMDDALDPATGAFRPGDLLELRFLFAPELTTQQRVMPSGEVALPLFGLFTVYGKPATQVLDELGALYEGELQRPELNLTVLEYARPPRVPRVYVAGAVLQGGAFDIDRPVTALQAIAMAGGRTPGAHGRRVAVLRVEDGAYVVRVAQTPTRSGATQAGGTPLYLRPDDVVFVPQSRLASAADVSEQLQRLLFLNGLSGSVSYRIGDLDLEND